MKMVKALMLLVAMIVFSCVAQAHDYSSDLGQDKSATDFHSISCGNGTDYVYFNIVSFEPSSSDILVSAKIIGENTFSVTDSLSADMNKSVEIAVPTKTDSVLILVSKNKAGNVSYTIDFHCQSANGNHTETDLSTLQNQ